MIQRKDEEPSISNGLNTNAAKNDCWNGNKNLAELIYCLKASFSKIKI